MTERQKLILLAVVKEYIKNAQPVGSMLIFEKYNFGISPATFRSEFSELERLKYLYQPYTSSGRVPTDKGYRFFVNHILEKRQKEKEKIKILLEEIIKEKKKSDDIFADLVKNISSFSGNAVLSGPIDSKVFFKSGINKVLSQPELDDLSLRTCFGDIVDSFEDKISTVLDKLPKNEVLICIGKESPFSGAEELSMIVSKCNLSGKEGVIAILGPKRMDYAKNINLINSLKRIL